jgi:glycosyltransferase involved in cell wall biosynthesis
MPKVSILMPVYNGEKFLPEAIESMLGQTFTDFEFMIIDDGSTDNSVAIIQSYQENRIRLLRNECNLGITESLNKGLAAAQGELICRMDADDVSLPERLETQVKFLDEHPDVAMVGTWVILIDSNGKEIEREHYPVTSEQIFRKIFIHNPFAHSTVLIRRSAINEVGVYDPQFLHNEDYDLWLRVSAKFKGANIPQQLVRRRIHEKNITIEKKIELIRYRIRTLRHAIDTYYQQPLYYFYLLRPLVAYCYHRSKALLR